MYNSLRIVVLGCSGTYAAPGGACSGYLVESQDTKVWLDAGPGTLSNIQLHTQATDLDALVLTHEHGDHWLELPVLYKALQHVIKGPTLKVYGTAATKSLAEMLLGEDLNPVMDFQVIADGDEISIGGQRYLFSETDHPVETLAVKVSVNGTTFAFSADTGPNWDPSSVSKSVDLFLCEATHTAKEEASCPVHLSARQAGEMARQSGARRLVVTHRSPECDAEDYMREASEAFGQSVESAEVHAVYNL